MPSVATVPRSSYLHVPFCARRCGYCNFAVVADRLDLADAYLRAIRAELNRTPGVHKVDTLYFGGGTPTELPADKLAELCEALLRHRTPASGYEWTIEANPLDIADFEDANWLGGQGINRVSLGAQSLDAKKLERLERDHSPRDVRRAVEHLRAARLGVSIDLIFAAPGESLDDWLRDLEAAIALAPDHVSTYGLTYEQGAAFWGRLRKGDLVERSEELQRRMYTAAIDRLTDAGFEHYEVSNFARPGMRSRHNEAYWLGHEYFAEGPGAARYIGGVRETNHRSTTTYLKRVLAGESPVAEREELTAEQRARERLVFGLRRLEGVSRNAFRIATGYDLETLAGTEIELFTVEGLLAVEDNHVRLTRDGLMVSDAMWPALL